MITQLRGTEVRVTAKRDYIACLGLDQLTATSGGDIVVRIQPARGVS